MPGGSGWEPWSPPACLSVLLCAHGLEAADQGTWGQETPDVGPLTLTMPCDSHCGTCGRLPAPILPAPAVTGVGEGLQEGLTRPGRWSLALSSPGTPS